MGISAGMTRRHKETTILVLLKAQRRLLRLSTADCALAGSLHRSDRGGSGDLGTDSGWPHTRTPLSAPRSTGPALNSPKTEMQGTLHPHRCRGHTNTAAWSKRTSNQEHTVTSPGRREQRCSQGKPRQIPGSEKGEQPWGCSRGSCFHGKVRAGVTKTGPGPCRWTESLRQRILRLSQAFLNSAVC